MRLTRWRPHWLAFLLIAVVTLSVVGCGSGSPPATRTPALPASASSSHTFSYGLDINAFDRNIGPARVPQALQLAASAGARVIRIGSGWNGIQPESATSYTWSSLDALLRLAHEDHLQLLLEIGSTPRWDSPDPQATTSYEYPPVDCLNGGSCQSVTTFTIAFVQHLKASPYRSVVRGMIPRNEPQNYRKNWIGGTAAEFAVYQHAMYAAAHAVDSRIAILNGGTEQFPIALVQKFWQRFPPTAYEQREEAFAQALYTNPLWCQSIDILDVHAGAHGPVSSPEMVDASEHAIEHCNGGKHVPVWVTEVGYSYLPAVQAQPQIVFELGDAYEQGASSQAQFLTDTFDALRKDTHVIGVNWTFLISPSDDPHMDGAGAGLTDITWQQEPSFTAYQHLARNAVTLSPLYPTRSW